MAEDTPAREGPASATAPRIAIDLGGTHTRVALATTEGQAIWDADSARLTLIAVVTFPTAAAYTEQLTLLTSAVASAQALAREHGLPPPAAIGVSVGGRIGRDGATVSVAPNLRDYEGRPLAADLRAAGGVPTYLAHDAVCGLLAERRLGALTGCERCAYLTLSTGTGCALRLGSRDGDDGVILSIEMGHQILDGNDRVCLCGQTGCLETYTGGRQLEARLGRPVAEVADPAVWVAFTRALAIGLVNLAQLTRVERVALGGAIALRRPTLLADLRQATAARLRGATLALTLASCGEEAPLLGAALLPGVCPGEILH